jgi:S-adenosylmethionine decarboxylase
MNKPEPNPLGQEFEFYGRHLLLNFSGCAVDLNDVASIRRDMARAIEVIGATILSVTEHKFEPEGMSLVMLLAESHASIHTYPEHKACFLDVFTCGSTIRVEPFGELLEQLWQPTHVSRKLHERFDPKFDINAVADTGVPILRDRVPQLSVR